MKTRQTVIYKNIYQSEVLLLPKLFDDYLHPDAILMSYEDGERIADIDDATIVDEAVALLENLLMQTIAHHDMALEDLHPGNFLVRRNGAGTPIKIVLLDFGRMARLTEDERANIQQFVAAIMMRADADTIADIMEMMSDEAPGYSREELVSALETRLERAAVASPDDAFDIIQDLMVMAGDLKLFIREAYLTVLKAVMTLQGTKQAFADR